MRSNAERLILRIERCMSVGPEERQALEAATATVRRYGPRDNLAKQGAPVERIFLIVEGCACRYRLLPDGRRQITAFLLPGDLCDTRTFAVSRMDHSILALSPLEAAVLGVEAARRLEGLPTLAQALAWNSLVHQSIAREWLVNVGHRTAFERLSHLFCEMYERLQAVNLVRDGACELPLTQAEIADTLALSAVHVNRTLMELRRTGLVTFHSKQLVIHDHPALCRAAGFDPSYLHHSPVLSGL